MGRTGTPWASWGSAWEQGEAVGRSCILPAEALQMSLSPEKLSAPQLYRIPFTEKPTGVFGYGLRTDGGCVRVCM